MVVADSERMGEECLDHEFDLPENPHMHILSAKPADAANDEERTIFAKTCKARAKSAFEQKDMLSAEMLWGKSIEFLEACGQKDAAVYSNRSMARLSLGCLEDALKDADEAIRIKPSFVKAYFRKGQALLQLQRPEEAIKAYEAGQELEPENKAWAAAISNASGIKMCRQMKSDRSANTDRSEMTSGYAGFGVGLSEAHHDDSDSDGEVDCAAHYADIDNNSWTREIRRSYLSMFLLFVVAGPGVVGAALMVQSWYNPLLRLVGPQEKAQVESVFFGGKPWLVSCVTKQSAKKKPPKVLEDVAEALRAEGVNVARVHCWEHLQTKRGPQTLAKRFGFRDQPPITMVSRGKGTPSLIAASGLNAKQLEEQVLATLKREKPVSTFGTEGPEKIKRQDKVGKRPKDFEEEGAHGTASSSDIPEEGSEHWEDETEEIRV